MAAAVLLGPKIWTPRPNGTGAGGVIVKIALEPIGLNTGPASIEFELLLLSINSSNGWAFEVHSPAAA